MSEPQASMADNLVTEGASAAPLPPVVVVEDDATCLLVVRMHLQLLALANPVLQGETGEAAITLLAQLAQNGTPPALVLLDGHLGELSGLEVLRWMRAQEALLHTPVVMLTGESAVGWISEAYQLGVASYLVKPVGFGALEDALRRLSSPWALLPP